MRKTPLLWVGGAVLVCAGMFDPPSMQAYAAERALQPAPVTSTTAAGSSGDVAGDAPKAELTPASPSDGTAANTNTKTRKTSKTPKTRFEPPAEDALPEGPFGDVIRLGRRIFTETPQAVPQFVGNSMRCSSCHMDAGRLADSAPLWAAWVSYPAYRSKTHSVNSFSERLQGCFQYSMNGRAPPADDPALIALESYAYWLASGATVDPKQPGRGYPDLAKPPQAPDYARGRQVYEQQCALCHGADGAGQRSGDVTVFPALWGNDSYNWGAGMGRVNTAAAFIKANMPLGLAGSLSDQQAWDVALFMDSHERPQDPRYSGSVAKTRSEFHDTPHSMYGRTVDGLQLGDTGAPKSRR